MFYILFFDDSASVAGLNTYNLELAENVLNLPYDFSKSFTKSTAELLSNMMYQKPELRPKIALALQRLVEKYKTLLDSTHDDAELKKLYKLDRATITKNLEVLQKYSPNFLAVFFNVFSETLPLYRGYMLNVIKAYLEITPLKDLNVFFNKALDLLKQSLETQLYDMAVTTLIFKDDGTLQKKGYKLLKQITESENNKSMILENIEDLQNKLSSTVMTTVTPVKNVRLLTFINIIKILPESDLHMIPDILSETILCTKEPREKTRSAAYELLVVMANKMKNGGTVVISKVSEADPNSADVEASINEFVFSMVVAGLAATTPHMISATITSISRLIFEFKKDLDIDLVHQLLYTMDNFVNCKSREIVKSALGFFKVATISLDVDILTPHLSQIIIGLLVWSNEHKNRFKVKVRHILERMIRRFGYDIIEKHVPEITKKRVVYDSAYDEALYGSESDLEDSDDHDNNSDVTAENHYLESKNSSVAFTLGLKQKLKYTNKNSNDMDIDSYITNTNTNNKKHIKKSNEIEPIDAVASRMAKKQKKKEFIPIGKEYKAKKAGGDIKKSGKPDPYAYVPLSSMYHKKGQQKVKISLISKGKVSKRQTKIRKKY
nr:4427_t:CDS:2 [Entrophospora candida]